VLRKYNFYFADLHFHTEYSDNRDRATIRQMVSAGIKNSVSIFGVGDHNHNLTLQKWKKQVEQVKEIQKEYKNILIWSNCEITFLSGHFLILDPEKIDGSINEGYDFLYGKRKIIKVLNHPDPATDKWQDQLIPYVSAIEVINGTVFIKAKKNGFRFSSPLDIPFIRTYANYLKHDYPVAVTGNSDAHEINEIGSGLTGFRLPAEPMKRDIINAIRNRKTFATTDPGITVLCSFDEVKSEYCWNIEWNPVRSLNTAQQITHKVELYNRDKIISDNLSDNGSIPLSGEGLYWITAYNKDSIVVSSPFQYKKTCRKPSACRPLKISYRLYGNSLKDINRLSLDIKKIKTIQPIKKDIKVKIEILSRDKLPNIIDSAGRTVKFELISKGKQRKIIDKTCMYPCFEEFFVWLKRNEIHEYNFLEIQYSKSNNLLKFEGLLVPAKMVYKENVNDWYRKDCAEIKNFIDGETRYSLFAATLYSSVLYLNPKDYLFPLKITCLRGLLKSELIWVEDLPVKNRLREVLKAEEIEKLYRDPWQHIFQVFI